MPLLVIFIIWYNLWGKNNTRTYRRVAPNIGKIIGGLILLSIFGSIIPELLGIGILLSVFVGPPFFIFWAISKALGKDSKRDRKSDYEYYNNNYSRQQDRNSKNRGTSVTGLTRSVPKRRKIVEKFNKRYNLNLTDKEVDRIVDASYMSNCWEREIFEMDKDFDSIAQWYNGDSAWLRAYLRAFSVQNVSSDFEMQHQICLETFTDIFDTVNPAQYPNIDECVEAINNQYYTLFDETTFMIAYRFLESNGRKYKLPSPSVLRGGSEIDMLKRKYDETEDAGAASYGYGYTNQYQGQYQNQTMPNADPSKRRLY